MALASLTAKFPWFESASDDTLQFSGCCGLGLVNADSVPNRNVQVSKAERIYNLLYSNIINT
jgi:hypothetical protein